MTVNLEGKTIAGCKALRRSEHQERVQGAGVVWVFRCGCGVEFDAPGNMISRTHRKGFTSGCPKCLRERKRFQIRRRNRARAAEPNDAISEKYCPHCLGMGWRRPVGGVCHWCREPFTPENITEQRELQLEGRRSRWVEPEPADLSAHENAVKVSAEGYEPRQGTAAPHARYLERVNGRSIDMLGKIVAGCRVLERLAAYRGEARWRVAATCGHLDVASGWVLRNRERHGEPHYCAGCRRERGIPKVPKVRAA